VKDKTFFHSSRYGRGVFAGESKLPAPNDTYGAPLESALQILNSANHPLPVGMKIALVGMVFIGFFIFVIGRGLEILKAKIHDIHLYKT
jgi:hypothetical protein